MDLYAIDTKTIEQCVRKLEHAKGTRGLLQGTQKALDDMKAELERRADIEYCKAHDC